MRGRYNNYDLWLFVTVYATFAWHNKHSSILEPSLPEGFKQERLLVVPSARDRILHACAAKEVRILGLLGRSKSRLRFA